MPGVSGAIGLLIAAAASVSAAGLTAQPAPLVPFPSEVVVNPLNIAARGLGEDDFPRLKRIAPNVYVFEALHQSIKTLINSSLVLVTDDGVLVADGHGLPATTTRLVETIHSITAQPIKYVVIGSEHGDHTGGNAAFPESVTFIAHPSAQAALERQAATAAREGRPSTVRIPSELVTDRLALRVGGTAVEVRHIGRAHTGADLMVYLPAEKILWMSESFHHGVFPSVGGGYPSEWIEALKRAEAMDVKIFAPAHGFVDSPEVLLAGERVFRGALEALVEEGRRLKAAGVTAEQAPSQANLGPYAALARYAENIGPALARVYLELEGRLPPRPE